MGNEEPLIWDSREIVPPSPVETLMKTSALHRQTMAGRLGGMRHQLDFEKPIAELQSKLEELKKHPETHSLDISVDEEVASLEVKIEEMKRQIYLNLSAWDRIKIARHPKRPFSLDYLETAFTDFSELHGDRLYAED